MAMRLRRGGPRSLGVAYLVAAFAILAVPSSALAKHAAVQAAAAQAAAQANVGWGGFGNTPDENRHSPLTLINQGNVSQLGRQFTVDFKALDPTIRLGEQSFPVEQNGTLYMTTNDGNVWALNADHRRRQMAVDAEPGSRLLRFRNRCEPGRRGL